MEKTNTGQACPENLIKKNDDAIFNELKEKIRQGEILNEKEQIEYRAIMMRREMRGESVFTEQEYKEADKIMDDLQEYKISQEIEPGRSNSYYKSKKDTLIFDLEQLEYNLGRIYNVAMLYNGTLEKFSNKMTENEKKDIFNEMLNIKDKFLKLLKPIIDFLDSKITKAIFFKDISLEGSVELEIPEFAKDVVSESLIRDLYEKGRLIDIEKKDEILPFLKKCFVLGVNFRQFYPQKFLEMAESLKKQLGY